MGQAVVKYGAGRAARDISDIRVRLAILAGTQFVDVETGSGVSSRSVSGADVMIPAWYIEAGSVQSSRQISGADIRIPAHDAYAGTAQSPHGISGADVFSHFPFYVDTGTVVSSHGSSGTAPVISGIAGRLAEFRDSSTLRASTLIKSGAGVLTLSAASAMTATFPAVSGTVAVMNWTDNVGGFGITGELYVDYIFPRENLFLEINTDIPSDSEVINVVSLYRSKAGGAADGFGERINLTLDSSTTLNQQAATIDALWNVATHASRVADLVLSAAYSGGLVEGFRIRGGAGVAIGLYGVTPVVRPATGGSAATFTQNSGNAVNDASTFDGYTIGQIVKALRDIGALT